MEDETGKYEEIIQAALERDPLEIPERRNLAGNLYTLFNLRVLKAATALGLDDLVRESDQLSLKFDKLVIYYPHIRRHSDLIQGVQSLRNRVSHSDRFGPSPESLRRMFSSYSDFAKDLDDVTIEHDRETSLRLNARDDFESKREKVGLWIETIPPTLRKNYEANMAKVNGYVGALKSLSSVNTTRLDDESIGQLTAGFDFVLGEFESFIQDIQSYCPDCGSKLESVEEERFLFSGNPESVGEPSGVAWTVKIVCKKCDKEIDILNDEVIDI